MFQIYRTSHFETPENNQITPISSYNFIDFPSHLEFSNDSKLFLVGLYKRGMCCIRSLESEDWIADIDEVNSLIRQNVLICFEFQIKNNQIRAWREWSPRVFRLMAVEF